MRQLIPQTFLPQALIFPCFNEKKPKWEGIIHPMEQPPDFLRSPLRIIEEEIFEPTAIPRKGGIIAWVASLLIGIVVIIRITESRQFPCLTFVLFLFFLFAAILITFSYWVDSKTLIRVAPSQLSYQSPFRRFLKNWDQISEINAHKGGHFWRIVVSGKQLFFTFSVGEERDSKTQPERVLALPHGDRLARIICGMANLSQIEKVGEKWICSKTS
jgi:hypothetical protein